MHHVIKSFFLLILCSILFASLGCSPVRRGMTDTAFYSTGQPKAYVHVEGLNPIASGKIWSDVPSNVQLKGYAGADVAMFGEANQGSMVSRHAHVMLASFSDWSWQWRMESWPNASALIFQKSRTAGKNWTVQIIPVPAMSDWFSQIWRQEGKKVPRFWIAKRWSATPEINNRIVAEYREPAPECMQAALSALEHIMQGEQVLPPTGTDLNAMCREEVNAFSSRADSTISFGELPQILGADFTKPLPANIGKANFKALIGEAEYIEKDGGDMD